MSTPAGQKNVPRPETHSTGSKGLRVTLHGRKECGCGRERSVRQPVSFSVMTVRSVGRHLSVSSGKTSNRPLLRTCRMGTGGPGPDSEWSRLPAGTAEAQGWGRTQHLTATGRTGRTVQESPRTPGVPASGRAALRSPTQQGRLLPPLALETGPQRRTNTLASWGTDPAGVCGPNDTVPLGRGQDPTGRQRETRRRGGSPRPGDTMRLCGPRVTAGKE